MKVRPWPDASPWAVELMEERFANTALSAADLRARADELREEARTTDLEPYREVALALADRYELAAATRSGAD